MSDGFLEPDDNTGLIAPSGMRGAVIAVVTGLVILAALVGGYLGFRKITDPSADERYLSALDDFGLRSAFPADRAATTQGRRVCEELDAGAPVQGSRSDFVAVTVYCDEYEEPFKILEEQVIRGKLDLRDGVPRSDTACTGSNGYGDIRVGTDVVVRNSDGDELARTGLGSGETSGTNYTGSGHVCTFGWQVTLLEGESAYLVAVGQHAEVAFSWDEMKEGPALTLGP